MTNGDETIMHNADTPVESLLFALRERTKELNCLYEVEELFSTPDSSLPTILEGIVRALPDGWQYPDVCRVQIKYGDLTFQSPDFKETPWVQSADLYVQDHVVGRISVYYVEERPSLDEGPFLKEERKLIDTVADRLERRILHERMRAVFEDQKAAKREGGQWSVILDLLKRTDTKLLTRISRKMLNHLSWSGIDEANKLIEQFGPASKNEGGAVQDLNRPSQVQYATDLLAQTDGIFAVASKYLAEKEILECVQKWIMEDRSSFLVKILEDPGCSLAEVTNAIERFHHLAPRGLELAVAREKGFRVALTRRVLNDDPHYIKVAKRFIDVNDFYGLFHHIIFPAGSHGKMGGKGSGLFLASQILRQSTQGDAALLRIKTPKTWYLTSDGILTFIRHNDLEEIVEKKYEDIATVRQEYPYVVNIFKNSPLPPEIVNGLSVALDDFGEVPLIVRSSSLLEDRTGSSFAGKYKSLFIANQGSKRERLLALMDAIVEVYASTFSPDAIEYRVEHGMIDSHEEMGILIQQVVGARVGDYFLPSFAGVAFSRNEFRWSHRIRREDGLVRMVPGLGTRAVDRLSDDYPVLLSPGQPRLRANVTLEEKVRYSPKKIDVINLKTNSFETVDFRKLLRECGNEYPLIDQLVSVLRDDRLEHSGLFQFDFTKDTLVATFDKLVENTPVTAQLHTVLQILQTELAGPVDLEFAHDGKDLYLLQCRPQSYTPGIQPATIPRDIAQRKIIFSANRYVTNGTVSGITHIVFVNPQRYSELSSQGDLLAVGRAVGILNKMLPKRQFILMGPGRWGSRGDIKLGVSVTYADISNTAMLVEIARKQKGYVPELSFGTHFFQDLVEASIRYLPLYPDDAGVSFNEEFLTTSRNVLADLVPEYAHLADTVRVIDVRESSEGQMLQILMNGEQDEAVAILAAAPEQQVEALPRRQGDETRESREDNHWRWRLSTVESMAAQLDPGRFGVEALYVFGSTKNATAGPKSDIDLLVHFKGTAAQRKDLMTWLDGWSRCLSQMNYLRTGYKTDGLLDVHLVTDTDIRNKTSFALKIGAVTDAPRRLVIGTATRR